MTDDDQRPFQSLSAREAGLPLDTTLYEEVPEWLEDPLREWTSQVLMFERGKVPSFAQIIAIRLRLPMGVPRDSEEVDWEKILIGAPKERLLDVVDAVLQLHPAWGWTIEDKDTTAADISDWCSDISQLEVNLDYGGSAYKLDRGLRQLVRRIDPTVTSAVDSTVAAAPPDAAGHLRKAWGYAYGLHPDPTTAYREAVLAVEAVACPLVLPLDKGATLGKVLAHLKQAGTQWEMALLAKDGGSGPEPVVALLERLWTGQVSRHAGSERSRVQTQREAEAAVHLAVLAVQWLSAEVLRRK